MNRITLECLNNLLNPVNMRCVKAPIISGLNYVVQYLEHHSDGTTFWSSMLDVYHMPIEPEDLGFEIIGEGE